MAFNKQFAMGGNLSSNMVENIVMPSAGAYYVNVKGQGPRMAAGSSANSSAVITIANSTTSTTLFTSTAGQDGAYVDFNAAAGDNIRITISSSAAVDQTAHAVKYEIDMGSGQ